MKTCLLYCLAYCIFILMLFYRVNYHENGWYTFLEYDDNMFTENMILYKTNRNNLELEHNLHFLHSMCIQLVQM